MASQTSRKRKRPSPREKAEVLVTSKIAMTVSSRRLGIDEHDVNRSVGGRGREARRIGVASPAGCKLCARTRGLRNPMERSTRNAALKHRPSVSPIATRVTATWRPHTAKHPIANAFLG